MDTVPYKKVQNQLSKFLGIVQVMMEGVCTEIELYWLCKLNKNLECNKSTVPEDNY